MLVRTTLVVVICCSILCI